MSERIYFLQDIVSHLLDVSDLSNAEVEIRRALRSAVFGYEQATTKHSWEFYYTHDVFTLNAPFTDGVVDIDKDGLVTLKDSEGANLSWPTWAASGALVIGETITDVLYIGEENSHLLKLYQWSGQELTDQPYRLVHNRYLLNYEPRSVFGMWNRTDEHEVEILQPRQYVDENRLEVSWSGGTPQTASIMSVNDGGRLRWWIRCAAFPEIQTVFELNYIRRPVQPRWLIPVEIKSSDGTTVEIADPIPIGADLIGTYLRTAGNSVDVDAELSYGIHESNPALSQGRIVAASGTTLTVASMTKPDDGGRTQGMITDHLDIPDFLYSAALMYAEANQARIATNDMKMYGQLMASADEQMLMAMEQGPLTPGGRQLPRGRMGYVWDYPSSSTRAWGI